MGGDLSPESYLGLIKFQLEHDQKLLKYFETQKQIENAKLVSERIPLLINEISEVIDYVKTTKK
jgi:hypothetical protein